MKKYKVYQVDAFTTERFGETRPGWWPMRKD